MNLRLTGLSTFYLYQRTLADRNRDVYRTSEQLSSQKKINRPSDDPQGAKIVLSFKQQLDKIAQYKRNIDVSDRNLAQSESSLGQVKDVLDRTKDLALQASNGTLGAAQRTAIAEEVQQLQQQLLSISNTQVNGEYIFAGFKTDIVPFTLDNSQPSADPVATYHGDTNVRSVQISDSSSVDIQVRGDQVFMGDGSAQTVDLFQTLADLEVALRADNHDPADPDSIQSQLDKLDLGSKQVLSSITSIGARTNRLDLSRAHLDEQTETLKSFVSSIEDADISDIAFEYQRANTALQAAITSAGSVLQLPSLLDFIGK